MSTNPNRLRAKPLSLIAQGLMLIVLGGLFWHLPVSLESQEARDTGAKTPDAASNLPNQAQDSSAQARDYGVLPLGFEPNRGQSQRDVKFLSRGKGYAFFLTSNEAVMVLSRTAHKTLKNSQESSGSFHHLTTPPKEVERSMLRMKLVGANVNSEIEEVDQLPGKTNYLIGNDPSDWRTDIPTYAKIRYHGVYPGIDLVYYGNQRQLEYDFVVAPGADPSKIQIAIAGARNMQIDSRGDLVLNTSAGEVRQERPIVYQDIDGARRPIEGEYALKGREGIGFKIGSYDTDKPLIIDPVLAYSSYVGASGTDFADNLAVDAAGSAYVTGYTDSLDFPTLNPMQLSNGGAFDVFVTKLNPAGTSHIYSTYIGGNSDDWVSGIALNASNEAFIAGLTESTNFPTTASALQVTFAGSGMCTDDSGAVRPCRDGFIAKLNATGSALVYSTYLGGTADEWCDAITLDGSGNAYVTGQTNSTNFPTANPFQGVYGGGRWDAFLTKVNPSGTALTYSTYLGGGNRDYGFDIKVDNLGNAYLTGETASTDFPTANAFQNTYGGSIFDAFISKFNSSGSSLIFSTYLGGSGQDVGAGITIDPSGNSYVSIQTSSPDLPTTSGAFQTTLAGSTDAFIAKLNPAGSNVVYATYLGGSDNDFGYFIAVDSSGNAYVTGYTASANFPTVNPIQASYGGGVFDAFIAILNSAATSLVYSTYLGGSGLDRGFDIALDSSEATYVTGVTDSSNFPGTSSSIGGGLDGFVVKISSAGGNPTPTPTPTPTATPLVSFPFVGQQSDTIIFGHADVADRIAQSFKLPASSRISSINVIVWRGSVNDGVQIRLSSDLVDTLAISDVVPASQLGTTLTTQSTTFTFPLSQQPDLPSNTTVFFILERTGPLGVHQTQDYYVNLRAGGTAATYPDGRFHFFHMGNWIAQDEFDFFFQIFGSQATPTPTPTATPTPTPVGHSNVAFIPGFGGSQLYTAGPFFEDKLWIPDSWDLDVCKLRPNEDGSSSRAVYNKDGDIVKSPFHLKDVYGDFTSFMDEQVNQHLIRRWKPLPYDWRLNPERIVQDGVAIERNGLVTRSYLIDELEDLAGDSNTGKVTIVTHSNGGLVVKSLLNALKSQGKANLVDRVLMVATPQYGTPKGIAALLHGDDTSLAWGLLATKYALREAGETMVGAYNLLPSSEYFRHENSPVIEFDTEDPFLANFGFYGGHIATYPHLRRFLLGDDGARTEPFTGNCLLAISANLEQPNVLRAALLDDVQTFHDGSDTLQAWQPPPGIQIVQIAGWGLPTTRGIGYTSKRVCVGFPCQRVLSHERLDTVDGDGTVVSPSATALLVDGDGTVVSPSATALPVETFYVNLDAYNSRCFIDFFCNRNHGNMMGARPVQDLIRDLLRNDPNPSVDFVTRSKPFGVRRVRAILHSPVAIDAYDSAGNHTGVVPNPDPLSQFPVIEEQIPNSSLERFGAHWYLTLDARELRQISLQGIALGTFTLELEEFQDDELVSTIRFADIPVSQVTVGRLSVQHVDDSMQLQLDANGDGSIDFIIHPGPSNPNVSLPLLREIVSNLGLANGIERSLLAKIDSAIAAIRRGNIAAARGVLNSFAHEVQAQRGKHIPAPSGDALIGIANTIIASL